MGLLRKISDVHRNLDDKRISPTGIIVMGYLLIILIGTLILMLPVSSKSGETAGFLTSLFTATSATCVTGLTVVNTYSHWTLVGQVTIIALIQCGGLGFMAFATVFSLVLHRRISLRERLVMTQSFMVNEISGVVRLAKHILVRTLIAESIGAAILAIRFIPRFGVADGLFRSVFHSISAFCNAGFDIMGNGSMIEYAGDPLVCLTLICLMVFGGLGFFVWEDLREHRSFKRLNLHSKLVILMTVLLLILGTALFFVFEYSNAETIGNMGFFEKLLAAFFQSSTTRTAGFYTIPQNGLTTASKLLSSVLMFIGGAPGSTAGGIKTVTLAVMLVTAYCVMRGRADITCFERKIPLRSIINAIALTMVALTLIFSSSAAIALLDGKDMADVVYETASAFSTTGLSTGITPTLHPISKIILICLMYFGRVGLLTISLGLLVRNKISKIGYPEGKIIIG